MITKDYRPTINDPTDLKNWVLKTTSRVRTNKLKDCSVELTNIVRNKLFTTLGVAGGEKPVLFGIPVKLVSGSHFGATVRIPE